MINCLEEWLTKKAAEGWKLEEIHGWKFVFRKCKPYAAKFFAYSGFGTSIGISHDYQASKNRYAHSKNKLNKANEFIYEVDICKIDSNFKHYVSLRNKYYTKHYLLLLIFALVYTVIGIGAMLKHTVLAVLFGFGIVLTLYALFSVLILLRASHST